MLVVFRCVDIRRWAALSMEAAVMVVDVVCELLVCLVLRQLSIIGRNRPMTTKMVRFVFFIVVVFDSKGNKNGESVQFVFTV